MEIDINKIYDTIEAKVTEITGSRPNATEMLEIDLGLDSLDTLDITTEVERVHNVSLPEEIIENIPANATMLDLVVSVTDNLITAMERDKLNDAARDASDNAVFDSHPWNNYNEGFIKGAEWLMQQPLADRLTNEEKERIKIEYAELLKAQRKARQDRDTFYGNILSAQRGVYESIFGSDLFSEE